MKRKTSFITFYAMFSENLSEIYMIYITVTDDKKGFSFKYYKEFKWEA